MTAVDPNWEKVSQFVSDLQNASRLAAYVDTVVDVFESKAWRRYTDATGRSDEWLECEFDYFMIACGASYSDVQKLLVWDKVRAVDLAGAMESDDPERRRPLPKASEAWQSPTGLPLAELAARNGWTKGSGGLRVPPTPPSARVRARYGVSREEQAKKSRAERLSESRRKELDDLVGMISERASDDLELRYVIDGLRECLPGKGRPAASAVELQVWRADFERLGGDASSLAREWGVERSTAWRRIEHLRSNQGQG